MKIVECIAQGEVRLVNMSIFYWMYVIFDP
jgi:hypothetical protein